jgi:MFS family permease
VVELRIGPWRNAGAFFGAYFFSAFGYEFIIFIMTVSIYQLQKSAFDVSLFTALGFLPKLLAPFLGMIGDRFRKERTLGWASLIAAGLLFLLAELRELPAIYFAWLLISVCLVWIGNVRAALMTESIPGASYARGNSLVMIFSNSARLLAPFLGGLAAMVWALPLLLRGTAVLYILAACCCGLMRLPVRPRPAETAANVWRRFRAGLEYLRQDPVLGGLTFIGGLWRLCLGLQTSLLVVYVQTVLRRTELEYGIFLTVIGLGSILGSLVGPWLRGRFSLQWVVAGGLSLHFGSFALLGIVRDYHAALGIALISFAAFLATVVVIHTARDNRTGAENRGTVYGLVTAILTIPALVSILAGGMLASVFGADRVFVGSGLAALAGLWLILVWRSPFQEPAIPGAGDPAGPNVMG